MKKTFRFLLAGAFALLAFTACSDDKEEFVEPQEPTYDDSYWANLATISSNDSQFSKTDEGGEILFPVAGGTVTVNVDCGCDWTAENSADDLFATSTTSTTLTVTAEQNTVEEELYATITLKTANDGITFATVTVTQTAYDAPVIKVEAGEWHAPAVGALTTEIAVEASDEWTADADAEWLTVEQTETGITLTAGENELTEEREATVTLTVSDDVTSSSVTVTVTQDGLAYINLVSDSLELTGEATMAMVTVESNFEWEYSSDAEWLTLGKSGDVLTVTVTENTDTDAREAVVTLTAGDGAENTAEAQLTISQESNVQPLIFGYILDEDHLTTQLPLSGTVDCVVDWGDNTEPETVTTTQPSHTYSSAGYYTISVTGTVTALSCSNISTSSSSLPLSDVVQWGNTGLTSMEYAFNYSTLESLPDYTGNAFANVTTFASAFSHCANLTTVPSCLFDNCTKVTSLASCFNSSNLREVPSGLFDDCTAVTTISSMFAYAPITTLPEGLFDSFTEVTNISSLFAYAEITSVPSGLFSKMLKVNNIIDLFQTSKIEEIPEGLFDTFTNATSCYHIFYDAASLRVVPDNLFDHCESVTTFEEAFQLDRGTSVLEALPSLRGCKKVTSFLGCFAFRGSVEGESPYDIIEVDGQEVKVHLYERSNYPEIFATPTGTGGCFYGCTKLTDYYEIPSAWSGGGN